MSSKKFHMICNSDDLKSGGTGVKFNVSVGSQPVPAFVVRFEGSVYAYLNRCAHMMLELDWDDAEYFDTSGEYLICSNHGALYEPNTGVCVNGPCYGASLIAISVKEIDSIVILDDERFEIHQTEES